MHHFLVKGVLEQLPLLFFEEHLVGRTSERLYHGGHFHPKHLIEPQELAVPMGKTSIKQTPNCTSISVTLWPIRYTDYSES